MGEGEFRLEQSLVRFRKCGSGRQHQVINADAGSPKIPSRPSRTITFQKVGGISIPDWTLVPRNGVHATDGIMQTSISSGSLQPETCKGCLRDEIPPLLRDFSSRNLFEHDAELRRTQRNYIRMRH
jgi:hypothetical protein